MGNFRDSGPSASRSAVQPVAVTIDRSLRLNRHRQVLWLADVHEVKGVVVVVVA